MRRVKKHYVDSIVYLNSQKAINKNIVTIQGTGFMLGIPDKNQSNNYSVFVVTCKHLLGDEKVEVIVNTRDGLNKVIITELPDWKTDPVKDLAIYPLAYDEDLKNLFIRLDFDAFHGDMIDRLNIGTGDEAYVLGRFINLEGDYKNQPICRSGIIAISTDEPIYNSYLEHGNPGYLLDLNIKKGFSGSPVFVQYENRIESSGSQKSDSWSGDRLIGIVWGGIDEEFPIKDHNNKDLPGAKVSILAGLIGVEPIKSIIDLIKNEFPDLF
ncbi:MAG: trypsin-like peptidase domain-containing protein [Candidatus Methanofastidiosa archaeon]|nr:trypsin-like peptidase domain-containing protein [Candidatus Methanofastidiosa archaeon]